ncbi:MAG: DUF5908 family protein [Cyanobacteriota bacterium]
MTIEIRPLVIRAVVASKPPAAREVNEADLVARCVRAVLHQLERRKER